MRKKNKVHILIFCIRIGIFQRLALDPDGDFYITIPNAKNGKVDIFEINEKMYFRKSLLTGKKKFNEYLVIFFSCFQLD